MRSRLDNGLAPSNPDELVPLTGSPQSPPDAQAAPKSCHAQAFAIVHQVSYPMAFWTLDRRWCVFNEPARQVLGCSEEQVLERPESYLERIHPQDRHEFLAAWGKLQDGRGAVSCRYRLRFLGGDLRMLRETSLPFPIPGSDIPGGMTLYAEEKQNVREIAEAHRLRKLLRGFIHEMGNHLQAISGELELLRWSGALSPDSAAAVSSGILRIRNLGYDLQDYLFPYSAESGDRDVAAVLSELARSRDRQLRDKNIHISMTLEDGLPRGGLNPQLAKALAATVDFCVGLMRHGGELRIEAGRRRCDGEDSMQITIGACGAVRWSIEANDVFRPFINVDGYRPGLGMTVARRILLRHSAQISFRKERPNRGNFLISIPAAALSSNAHGLD